MPNLVSLTCNSFQILGKTQTGIFLTSGTSGQSLIKENCQNSRTRDDIGMKFEQSTKFNKRNKTRLNQFDDDVMPANCDIIAIFLIYGQFGAILKRDSRSIICKTYIFIKSNLLSYKNRKQNEKIFNTSLTLLFWMKEIFLPKNADISKTKKALVPKGVFPETTYVCVLTYQTSSF